MLKRSSQDNRAVLALTGRAFAVSVFIVGLILLGGCGRHEPLTKELADQLLKSQAYTHEPIYAEVPQRVVYGPRSPEDDYDGKAVRTLHNLQAAGLVTVTEKHDPDGTATFQAKVTDKGFTILGTMPSARGPVYRGKIAEKLIDGVRNFERHPNNPDVGRAELEWHYDNPTFLYPMFETKINKPLKKPFVSLISFYYKNHAWYYDVTVKKTEAM